MSKDESGFLTTRGAADYLGLSHRTLDGSAKCRAKPSTI